MKYNNLCMNCTTNNKQNQFNKVIMNIMLVLSSQDKSVEVRKCPYLVTFIDILWRSCPHQNRLSLSLAECNAHYTNITEHYRALKAGSPSWAVLLWWWGDDDQHKETRIRRIYLYTSQLRNIQDKGLRIWSVNENEQVIHKPSIKA